MKIDISVEEYLELLFRLQGSQTDEGVLNRIIEEALKVSVVGPKENPEPVVPEKEEAPAPKKKPGRPKKKKEEPEPEKVIPLDRGKIKALYTAGWSMAKIADEMGCTYQRIDQILKEEGMKK